ncbi:hypothetical protein HZC34_05275 [Candidatus Saganbacteria bacterium]|nr:hypothetical protein [Candidatus Saganbacteria bacterium]
MVARIGSVHPSNGVGGGGTVRTAEAGWRRAFRLRTDLQDQGSRERLTAALKPAFTAAIEAFRRLPLATRISFAAVSHDEAYFKPSVLSQLGADGIYVAPAVETAGREIKFLLTKDNAEQLKACLTKEGQEQIDNMVNRQFVGKAFVTPTQIIPGKVADFFAFFGKTDSAVIAKVEDLAAKGKATKILNNLYMSSRVMAAYIDRFYADPEKNAGMREMTVKLQEEGVADSVLVIAALDLGLISQDTRYVSMHEAWATHNGWDSQAAINFADLPRDSQSKDETILDTHMGIRGQLLPLIDAVKVVITEEA